MIDDDERRIREKAYELWVAEGRPEGRAQAHWEQAREIIATKDAFDTTLVPLSESLRDEAEPAIAFENQGEFPEMRDEGQNQTGPTFDSAIANADQKGLSVGADAPKRGRSPRAATSGEKPEKAGRGTTGSGGKPAGSGGTGAGKASGSGRGRGASKSGSPSQAR